MPVLSDLHIDTFLTNVSIRYKNEAYLADRIFPIVTVAKQSDKYPVYTKHDWFRDEAQLRAPGGTVATISYGVGNATYFCENYAVGIQVPDENRAGADTVFNLDRDAVERSTDSVYLKRERMFVADCFGAADWATTASITTKWEDSTSTPISDLEAGVETIRQNTGVTPNTLVLGYQVFRQLKHHPDFVDRIKYTQMGVVTEQLIGQVVGIPNVLVGANIYSASLEGAATPAYDYNWGKNALLVYVPPRASVLTPAAGYTFVWAPLGGTGPQVINRRRDDKTYSDVFECLTYFDQKITGCDLGYLVLEAVT